MSLKSVNFDFNTFFIPLKERKKVYDILNFEKVLDHLTKFVELKLEIYELKVKSQMVNIISGFAILGLIVSFGMFFIFFLSLTIGAFLNSVFESNYLGFAFIGLFYLVICLLLIFFRGKILKNRLFQAFFSDTLNHENDEQNDVGQD